MGFCYVNLIWLNKRENIFVFLFFFAERQFFMKNNKEMLLSLFLNLHWKRNEILILERRIIDELQVKAKDL